MKKILLLSLILFVAVSYGQKKIVVNGGGGTPIDTTGQFVTGLQNDTDTSFTWFKGGVPYTITVGGDVLTVSGDTLYKNGVFLAELGGGGSIDTTGQFVTSVEALNDTVARSKKGGVWTNFNIKGRNFHAGSGLTRVSQSFKLGGALTENTFLSLGTYVLQTTGYGTGYTSKIEHNGQQVFTYVSANYKANWLYNDSSFVKLMSTSANTNDSVRAGIFIGSDGYAFSVRSGTGQAKRYSFPLNAPSENQILKANSSGDLIWANESGGGGGSNFPTVDDTLPGNRFLFSDTYNLLFSHASGNAFTLSNTGLSYDIGGNNAIAMNSSSNEFKTGNISIYGMLKTTNNTARLYATDGTNTSTVVAHPKYVELDGKDSTVIKNIDEVAIDTATQHVAVLQGNQVKKVKWQTLKADSTLTITGDSISVNLPKALGYREYVASLVQTGTYAPVATVLFNNLGDSVVWLYSGAGFYFALLYNGGTPASITGNVVVSMTNNYFYNQSQTKFNYINAYHDGADVYVETKNDTNTSVDDSLGEPGYATYHTITIRIYD